jgi:hypothetical protein
MNDHSAVPDRDLPGMLPVADTSGPEAGKPPENTSVIYHVPVLPVLDSQKPLFHNHMRR